MGFPLFIVLRLRPGYSHLLASSLGSLSHAHQPPNNAGAHFAPFAAPFTAAGYRATLPIRYKTRYMAAVPPPHLQTSEILGPM